MNLLNTPQIRKELVEIYELQEILSQFNPMNMIAPDKDAIEHLHLLYALVDKQHVVFTRLCLVDPDDKEAKQLKHEIEEASVAMGRPMDLDMNEFYSGMKRELKNAIQELDPTAFNDDTD